MNRVLILNLGGTEVLGTTSLSHAHRMLMRGVAVVHSWADEHGYGGYGIPRSVELVRYVFAKWKYNTARKHKVFSKKGVLKRDNYECSYRDKGARYSCHRKAVTIDHVLPRALGGKSTWDNCVACCKYHNSKKGSLPLSEVDFELQIVPYEPA